MGYKLKRILIYPDGVTEKQVYPAGWKPGANTLAYFPLEKDVLDYSGNNRNGTNNGVTFSNGLATFNNSYVSLGTASWTYIQPNETISAWFRPTSTSSLPQFVVAKQDFAATSQQTFWYGILLETNLSITAGWAAGNTFTYNPGASGITTSVNNWYNVVLTTEGTSKKIYVNGTLVASATANSSTSTVSMDTRIGNAVYRNANGYFYGNISRVIFEDKARTAQEVTDYYNITKSNYGL